MKRCVFLVAALLLCVSTRALAQDIARKSGFVDVPGGPVWYEIMGGGEGTPLLLLHGGPGSYTCYYQYLAPLGDTRPVIRYDQLGGGRSGRPTDKTLWNRDRFVEEVAAVRAALGLDEVHILGHSWGGALAAYYYLQTGGDGVKSLILSSPLLSTPRWIADANLLRGQLPGDVQAVLSAEEKAGTTDSKAYAQATRAFYKQFVSRGEAAERDFDCSGVSGNNAIYEQMWGPSEFYATGSLVDFDLTPRLKDIKAPTLFITGEYDEARPETLARFAALVPDSRLEVIPDVAHASFSRVPGPYMQIVRTFIATVDADKP
ncbi:MAG: proline iminopeptidase-family hydrolase [Sphingomonadales bacterium]